MEGRTTSFGGTTSEGHPRRHRAFGTLDSLETHQDLGSASDGDNGGRKVHHWESSMGLRAGVGESVEGEHPEGELESPFFLLAWTPSFLSLIGSRYYLDGS